ncbi:MAG: hypothetical protein K0S23_1010 [Fluviicola sp.]|jgi:hypothetical protein|uniref:T9SS type A sorting domain-containing protein n=1 Tax=Fluviicola sp. TaxID=1917219 RepID=UPI002604AA4E|nr:T9SS type A sorting domain-containing protein [Fluviicola sp.]MDF3026703.1 hypothetical protein [Fluviicola sp.]
MKTLFNTLLLILIGGTTFSQTTVNFSNSSTFNVPAGVTSLDIEVIGAGGAGGGNGGGGGGGGGYAKGTYAVTPGQILTVTVGVAGGGPAGGTSAVDMMISATGGANGTSVSNPTIGGGGSGGSGSGGTINRTGGNGGGYWTYFGGGGGGGAGLVSNGGNGGNTIAWTGQCQTPGGAAGTGGGAPGGDGGKGAGFTDPSCNVSNPSGNGLNYGGGGGGGNGNGGGPGTGTGGYVTITYVACTVDNSTTLNGITISANEAGSTYQWINCSGNTPIAGATSQSFTPTQTGNYAVIVNNGSCSDTSNCVNVVVCNLTATTTINGSTVTAVQSGTYQWINCSGNTPIAGATSQSFTPDQTGNYAVIINENGCMDTSNCVNVVVCTFTATTTVQGFVIHAVETGTYQWIDCTTSALIVNETGQNYSPATNGTYAVIITSNGCTDTSACVVITSLGIDDNELSGVNAYPNPFKSTIQVSNIPGNETFELINTVGQVIWSGMEINTKDFSSLLKGVYILQIMQGLNVRQLRLVKE